jgi:hypothetical protein
VAHYRVYRERHQSIYIPMAVVKPDAYYWYAGRLGLVDAPDYWPWPSIDPGTGPRCYTVSAVSTGGLEGPMSAEVCGSPPGGPPT